MFRRIDRYLFRELIPPFMLGLALYTFVLFMNHLFVIAEKALSKNLGWDLTMRLFLAGIPEILVLSIPMAVLLGVMIAVGRLSSDHEWIALQSSGQGPRRLIVPVLLFGLLASMASFFVQNELFPRASFWQRSLRGQLLFASNLASDLRPRGFYVALPDVVFFVDEIRKSDDKRLVNVVLHKRDRQTGESDLFLARYGDLYPDRERPGYLLVDLYDATQHHYDTVEGTDYLSVRWDVFRDEIDTGSFLQDILKPKSKGVQDRQLDELIAELHAARAERVEIEAMLAGQPDSSNRRVISDVRLRAVTNELHTRFALPLACLLFALLSIPLGITRVRSGKGAGFAVSLGVILVYYVTFTICRNQGYSGRIPVWLGVWAANILILPWAIYGLWKLHRPESGRSGWISRLYFGALRGLRDLRLRFAFTDKQTRHEIEEQTADEDPLASLSGTQNRFIGRFDGYVLRTFFKLLGYSLASTYLVFYLIEFKSLLDDGLFKHSNSWLDVLDLFRLLAPGNLLLLLPISCLVAAVITFTLLSRAGELTALKAAGVSMHRATLPVVLATIVLSIGLWAIDDRIAPTATLEAQAAEDKLLDRRPRSYGSPVNGTWGFGPEGKRLYHYDRHDPESDVYFGFSALTLDREGSPRIIDHRYSPVARWSDGEWELDGGWYVVDETLGDGGEEAKQTRQQFTEPYTIALDAPQELSTSQFSLNRSEHFSRTLSTSELGDEIRQLEQRGYDTTRLRVNYHAKWARPWAPLVMVLLGLPFAFKVGRRGSMYGVGVSLLLVLIYWGTFALFNALGLETLLDPIFAAWAPNVLFALIGSYLMLYIKT